MHCHYNVQGVYKCTNGKTAKQEKPVSIKQKFTDVDYDENGRMIEGISRVAAAIKEQRKALFAPRVQRFTDVEPSLEEMDVGKAFKAGNRALIRANEVRSRQRFTDVEPSLEELDELEEFANQEAKVSAQESANIARMKAEDAAVASAKAAAIRAAETARIRAALMQNEAVAKTAWANAYNPAAALDAARKGVVYNPK